MEYGRENRMEECWGPWELGCGCGGGKKELGSICKMRKKKRVYYISFRYLESGQTRFVVL